MAREELFAMLPQRDSLTAFGPVPSRRLGRSLGINNVPPKSCSYSCVYCQVGPTRKPEISPRHFYSPAAIEREVLDRVAAARRAGEAIDYLTFVPDGEPTLDSRLGETIDRLKPLGVPVAVISNGSLLWREDARAALNKADWVSVKVDTVNEPIWRRVNRPPPDLHLDTVMQGIREFSQGYRGCLTTETMLVSGVNDSPDLVKAVGKFLAEITPARSYLAVPMRPPAVANVRPPGDRSLLAAYEVLRAEVDHVEYLIGDEGDDFGGTGNLVADLLSITAVHPMRQEAVEAMLQRADADWSAVERLIADGELQVVTYAGNRFVMRRYVQSGGGKS